jgi:hypothetical protein
MSRVKAWMLRHPWWWSVNLLAAGVLILLSLCGHFTFDVGNFARDKEMTAALIDEFHQDLNRGRFNDIYESSSHIFRRSFQSSEVCSQLRQNMERFGPYTNVLTSELNVLQGPPVEVQAVYNSTFEKGIVTELFGYVKEDHKLKLAFYEIRPGISNLGLNEDRRIAEEAANEFYQRLSHEDYDAIFNSMSEDLRSSMSSEEVASHFRQINENLGNCTIPFLTDSDYAEDGESHFVGLKYERVCEGGKVNERLAFKIVNGKAMLRGYH